MAVLWLVTHAEERQIGPGMYQFTGGFQAAGVIPGRRGQTQNDVSYQRRSRKKKHPKYCHNILFVTRKHCIVVHFN